MKKKLILPLIIFYIINTNLFSQDTTNNNISSSSTEVIILKEGEITKYLPGDLENKKIEDKYLNWFIGAGPAIIGLELQKKSFYGYASTSLILPFLDNLSLNIGIGKTYKLTKILYFDVLFNFVPWITLDYGGGYNYYLDEYTDEKSTPDIFSSIAIGMSVGLRLNFSKGLVVSFKLPFYGFALGKQYSWRNKIESLISGYAYLYATTPIASIGVKF